MLRTASVGIVASLTAMTIAAGFTHAGPDETVGSKPTTTAPVPTAPLPTAPLPAASTPLQWGPCEDGVDAEFDCAVLTVPLDYTDPAGPSIGIALIRLPADPSRREGAVLFNPGGPGGSGVDLVSAAGSVLDTELGLSGRFDLIGFDPRGVDRSGGLRCLDDAEVDRSLYLDDTPETAAESQALKAADEAFTAGCIARYGDTLGQYSTDNTARDMDMIRAALGDSQISFIGISYGTYLGGVYATLFPDRVRAMVLDSAFEPTGDSELDQYVTQLVGFEDAFANWAAWCEEGTECLFSDIDVAARWDALIAGLDARPVKSASGRSVNQVVMETATISSLYNELSWPALGVALAEAEGGDGTALLALADSYEGRDDDGTFDTQKQAGRVIRCASGIDQVTPADPAALLAQLQAAAPRFSRGIGPDDFGDSCLDLLGRDVQATVPSYTGSAPIVVIGGLNDPATPYRWAEELTALMGPSATLVSFSGEGHGQILGSSCVTDIEGTVIADLQLPAPGTACDPDPDVPRPAFWDQIPVPPGVGRLVEDPTIDLALGLPANQLYSDVWYLTGDADEVEAAYIVAFEDLGFRVAPTVEAIPGTIGIPLLSPDGVTALVVVIIPAEALSTNEDLAGAADLAPPGQGFVVVAALADL